MSDIPSPPSGLPASNSPQPETTGLAPNIAAGLAAVFPLVGGIIFFLLEKKDKFVRFWAMQSMFLGGLALAVSIAMQIAGFVFGFIPVVGKLMGILLGFAHLIFSLAWFVVYVIGIVKAFTGKEWEIPWLGKLARQQLARIDGASPPPAA